MNYSNIDSRSRSLPLTRSVTKNKTSGLASSHVLPEPTEPVPLTPEDPQTTGTQPSEALKDQP